MNVKQSVLYLVPQFMHMFDHPLSGVYQHIMHALNTRILYEAHCFTHCTSQLGVIRCCDLLLLPLALWC